MGTDRKEETVRCVLGGCVNNFSRFVWVLRFEWFELLFFFGEQKAEVCVLF